MDAQTQTALRGIRRAVLIQAARDAAGIWSGGSNGGDLDVMRSRVKNWLGSRDFQMVCSLADVTPSHAAAGLKALLQNEMGKRGQFKTLLTDKERASRHD